MTHIEEGLAPFMTCYNLSNRARAPPLLLSLSLVFLFSLGRGKREGKEGKRGRGWTLVRA